MVDHAYYDCICDDSHVVSMRYVNPLLTDIRHIPLYCMLIDKLLTEYTNIILYVRDSEVALLRCMLMRKYNLELDTRIFVACSNDPHNDMVQQHHVVFCKWTLENNRDVAVQILDDNNSTQAQIICRDFNDINIEEGVVVKQSISEYGHEIMNKEIDFYNFIGHSNAYFPCIHTASKSTHMIKMQYLEHYKQLDEVLHSCDSRSNMNIYTSVLNHVADFHKQFPVTYVTKDEYMNTLYLETIDKITTRHAKIKDILSAIPCRPTTVNNVPIMTFDEVLHALRTRIDSYVEKQNTYAFHVIHGDLNFGNIMYNSSTNHVTFIDPRGFFGDQQFIGPVAADYAKIAFSLSGYDDFYKDPSFHFTLSHNDYDHNDININVNIHKKELYDTYYNTYLDPTADELTHILMISIWLGAPQYLEFNIPKLIASHYYSLYLATQYFRT